MYKQPRLATREKSSEGYGKVTEVTLGYIIKKKYIVLNAILQSLYYLVSYCK